MDSEIHRCEIHDQHGVRSHDGQGMKVASTVCSRGLGGRAEEDKKGVLVIV
jgi:hypothetical protein